MKPEQAMQPLSLRDLEAEARRVLDPAVYDYFAGGAGDEITLRENEAAFQRIVLVPRVLQGAEPPRLEISLLGRALSMPVLIAPTAFHRLAHPEGESATARAAAAAGAIMIVSMASTVAIEEIAAAACHSAHNAASDAGPCLWFQLYIQPDLDFTQAVIRRAEAAGCAALVITVDSPSFGRRERDVRNGFVDLPPGMFCENMREPLGHARFGPPRNIVFWPQLSWSHIAWLRQITSLKIVLKGILHPADARIALDHGVDALIVSNHGGRQLDTLPAAIDALPDIAESVGGKIPLLLDGGVRRGTDVINALARGAAAVAIGRPILWGLAVAGEQGVTQVLEMLRADLERALALCGCSSVAQASSLCLRSGKVP